LSRGEGGEKKMRTKLNFICLVESKYEKTINSLLCFYVILFIYY